MKIKEILLRESGQTVYYHATSERFEQFSNRFTGSIGFFFTDDYNIAMRFKDSRRDPNARIIAAHLTMNNPLMANEANPDADEVDAIVSKKGGGNPRKLRRELLMAKGYDSIIFKGEVVVFEPEQIHIIDHDFTK